MQKLSAMIMHLGTKRNAVGRHKRAVVAYVLAVSVAILSVAGLLTLLGFNPLRSLETILLTSVRTSFGLRETIKKFIPLLLTTYAFAIPLKLRIYNIGGLGQMRIGGIAAIIVTFEFAALPAVLLIPLTLVLCIVAAGGYGAVCGVLYNRYETNPIISTTMLNFVSHYLLLSVTTSQRYGDIDSGHPMSELVPASGTLPGIGQFPTVTLLVTVLVVVSVFVLMKRSALGYQIEATGHNPHASQTYGMNTKRLVVVVLFLGGACAGLAGTLQVIGIQGRLIEGFAITSGAEYGTFGILTALLSGGSPIGVVFASLFMAVLLVGADAMQRTIQVPVEIVFLMQTLMVVIIVTIRKRMGVIQSDG